MASQPAEVQIEEQPSTIVPATETPYRDDPDAEEDAEVSPLLQDEEQHVPPTEPPYRDGNNTDEPHQHGPTEPPARRPSDEEQPATTEENPNPDSPRRQFNFIMFHQITLGLAISIFLHFLARVLILHFARIPGYRGIHSVDQTIYGALLGVSTPSTTDSGHANPPTFQKQVSLHLYMEFLRSSPPPTFRKTPLFWFGRGGTWADWSVVDARGVEWYFGDNGAPELLLEPQSRRLADL